MLLFLDIIFDKTMDVQDVLVRLGFTKKESLIYMTSLELGQAPVSVIARKAKMKRSTTYEILRKLTQKGVAEFYLQRQIRFYSVLAPKRLLEKYKDYVGQLEDCLPSMLAVHNQIVNKPRITFYEGVEELRTLYMASLETKGDILNYFMPERLYDYYKEDWYQSEFIRERNKRGITIKVIMPDSPLAREFVRTAPEHNRMTRIIPSKDLFFESEIYIYDDKMAVFSFEEDIAFLIQSEDVVRTQKVIFDLAWNSSKVV